MLIVVGDYTVTDLFISYARKDNVPPSDDIPGFITRLHDALVMRDFTVWMDKRAIIPAGHFEQDIEKGIIESDAFLLIMSPYSLAPESFCRKEIESAVARNKRLIPVLRADATPDAPIPPAFAELDWIFAREDDDFDAVVVMIERVLRSGDQAYIHTHSRLLTRAEEWQTRGRAAGFLLRRGDLRDAEAWFQTSVQTIEGRAVEPRPTALHAEYLQASQRAGRAFQRVVSALAIVALVIMTGLAITALINAGIAERRALESRSLALAANAQSIADRDGELALALAVEANAIPNPPPLAQAVLSRYAYRPGNLLGRILGSADPVTASGDFMSVGSYSPDGRMFALGMDSGALSLWDSETLTLIRRLPAHTDEVGALAFSADGSRLLSAGGDRVDDRFEMLRLWDLADDSFIELAMDADPIFYVGFAPDGGRAYAVSGSGTAHAWDTATGAPLWTTDTHSFFVEAMFATGVLSIDGRLLYVTSRTEYAIYALDSATGTIVRTITLQTPTEGYGCFNLVVHPDGARILCVPNLSDAPGLYLHDLATGDLRVQYQPLERNIYFGTAFTKTGDRLVAAVGTTIRMWESENGGVLHTYSIDDTSIGLAYHPDGDSLLFDMGRGEVGVLDGRLRPGAQDGDRYDIVGQNSSLLSYDAERGGFWVARTGQLMLIDETDYGVRVSLSTGDNPQDMTMLPDGGALIAEENDRLSRWSADALHPDGQPTWIVDSPGGFFNTFMTNAAGTRLITSSYDSAELILWDTTTGERSATWSDLPIRVHNAMISPDGARVAASGCVVQPDPTACPQRRFVVWDTETGAERYHLDGRYFSIAADPDSSLWAVVDGDRTINLIDSAGGAIVGALYGHANMVTALTFNGDGTRLLSGELHAAGRMILWDVAARAALREIDAGYNIIGVTFSGSNDRFFSHDFPDIGGISMHGIQRWRLDDSLPALLDWTQTNRVWRSFTCGERARYVIAPLCGQGEANVSAIPTRTPFLAIAAAPTRTSFPRSATPTYTASPQPTATPTPALYVYRELYSANWSPDGTRLLAGEQSGFVVVWDVAAHTELFRMTGHQAHDGFDGARGAWSPDGERIVSFSIDDGAVIWDGMTGARLIALSGHTDAVNHVRWSPDGTRIVTASLDTTARVWDAATGETIAILVGNSGMINRLDFSPDGTRVATAGEDGMARVYDATTGRELFSFGERERSPFLTADAKIEVLDVVWSGDGETLIASGTDGLAIFWDTRTGERGLTLRVPPTTDDLSGVNSNWINSVWWSLDETRVLLHTPFTTPSLWDVRTGQPVFVMTGHNDVVVSARWSPDKARILTGGTDGTIRVWDAATGDELMVMDHRATVYSAVWSPDGTQIASTALNGTVRLWHAATGEEVPFLGAPALAVTAQVTNVSAQLDTDMNTAVSEIVATMGVFMRSPTPTATP